MVFMKSIKYLWLTCIDLFSYVIDFFNYIHLNEYIVPSIIKMGILSITVIAIYATRMAISISLKKVCKQNNINKHTRLIITKAINYIITLLGIIFALQNIGIQVTSLVTALGISGVAISFGIKDIISNITAGILIMAYQQFKVGDYIKIKDGQGKIIDINIRYTTLQTDDMTVYVPNSILYTTTVTVIHPKDPV